MAPTTPYTTSMPHRWHYTIIPLLGLWSFRSLPLFPLDASLQAWVTDSGLAFLASGLSHKSLWASCPCISYSGALAQVSAPPGPLALLILSPFRLCSPDPASCPSWDAGPYSLAYSHPIRI